MANIDINDVIKGMQSSMDRAQEKVDQRQKRLLEHLIEMGEDGEPKSLSWVSRLPSGDGGQRAYELVRLPWASLRSAASMKIDALSVDFDCYVDQTPSEDSPRAPRLTVTPTGKTKEKDPQVHNLKINLNSTDEDDAEIFLDEHLIKPAGSRDMAIPREILEPVRQRGHRTLWGWKSVVALLLIGLSMAAWLWWKGILPLP